MGVTDEWLRSATCNGSATPWDSIKLLIAVASILLHKLFKHNFEYAHAILKQPSDTQSARTTVTPIITDIIIARPIAV